MGRIAGDDPGYTFALCRRNGWKLTPTKSTFQLPSVSTIIGEVLAKPPSAMAWWGYKVACEAVVAAGDDIKGLDPESLYELLKTSGPTPNTSLEESGTRGADAHDVLEMLANGKDRAEIEKAAAEGDAAAGAEYCQAAIAFWDEAVQPNLDNGDIDEVRAEAPVFSLNHRYAGTLDLALHWVGVGDLDSDEVLRPEGWEICDAKTHKPASGFSKPGKGPGYISDATQCRAYRLAWEEMGLGKTIGQRTIVLRDRAYKGKRWLEDDREVSVDFWLGVRAIYEPRMAFDAGEDA